MQTETAGTQPNLYGPWATVLLTVGIYLGAQIVAGLVLSLIPVVQGWDAARVEGWLENNILAISTYLFLTALGTLVMVWSLLKQRRLSFRNLGLNHFQLKYIGYALGGFVVYFVLFIVGRVIAQMLYPSLNVDQEQDIGFKQGTVGAGLVLVFVCLVILPPITEEIVMRGFLFGGLRARMNFQTATLITSLIFGLAHLFGGKDGTIWIAAIDTFILSLVLCHMREKTGSLWPPIGVHMIKNALAFTVLFVVSR